MIRTTVFWSLALSLSLWTGTLPAQESVPSDDERAAAQVLFDEGRKLLKDEKIELACAKFAESMRLDHAIGTQLNLADCYEKLGRTASAWINWVDAAARARKAGQDKRQQIAEERAADLEGTLSRMTITVPHDVDGLEIRRDGELVGRAQWGIAMPVDPGTREISASAPGKKPWKQRVRVGKANDNVLVEVQKLADAPVEPKTTTLVEDNTPQLAGGIAALGVGAVGIGLGIGFGVLAMNKNEESLGHCLSDDENKCSSAGASLRSEAITFSHVSTAGFVVGGVGVVLGIVLIATTPGLGDSEEPEKGATLVPWLDPQSGGMLLHMRW